jgi:uncharacterized protein
MQNSVQGCDGSIGASPDKFTKQHMNLILWSSLTVGGFLSGILAGFLGIGGGTVLVPLLVALGFTPIQAIATSSLAILVTSISGTIQNWRMGYFDFKRILTLGVPAMLTAQLGVLLANFLPPPLLLAAFGVLLLLNIFLVDLRNRLTVRQRQNPVATHPSELQSNRPQSDRALMFRVLTGGVAGVLAGLFGVGGGVIMVPLQMLLLGESIKVAIQTSLAVVVITAVSATIGHTLSGNIIATVGVLLGLGGLIGVQVSTRVLPRLPDRWISIVFRGFLAVLALYVFWQAWQAW